MKRKRFVKLMMGLGYSRNHASVIANYVPVSTLELFGKPMRLTYARVWIALRAHARVKELAAKGGETPEA